MTPELTALALAGLLQVAQVALFALPADLETGIPYALSPRDTPPARPISRRSGRLQRAMNNHFEGLVLFTLAVAVVTLGEKSSVVTQAAAWVYLAARILYVPAYVFGWVPWRSVIWSAGFLATATMLAAALA